MPFKYVLSISYQNCFAFGIHLLILQALVFCIMVILVQGCNGSGVEGRDYLESPL